MHTLLNQSYSDSKPEMLSSQNRRGSLVGNIGRNGVIRGSFDENKRTFPDARANDWTEEVVPSERSYSFPSGRRPSSLSERRESFAMNRNDSIYSISSIDTTNGQYQCHKKGSLDAGNAGNNTVCARHRRKLANFLHTHVVLIVICVLAILDAACVVVQVIGDILIVKVELHELEMQTVQQTELLAELIPSWFNSTIHGEMTFAKTLSIVQAIKTSILQEFGKGLLNKDNIAKKVHRARRDVQFFGGEYGNDDEGHEMLHNIAHSFHFGSVAILSVLMFETVLKVYAMGKRIFNHKIEVFDAFVVSTSWILDVIFLKGIWMNGTEGATILVFLLPWRVIRVVNSFVVVIQEKGEVALKIAKSQHKSSVRRLEESRKKYEMAKIEIQQLRSLCKKKGATDDNLKNCKPKPRRKSSIFRRFSSSTVQTESSLDVATSPDDGTSCRRLSLTTKSIDVGNFQNGYIPADTSEIRRSSSFANIY